MNMFAALSGIAVTSFTVALSGALMPGPLLTVTVAEAARRGVSAGWLVVTGHAILELVLVVGAMLGIGFFLRMPAVMAVISVAGGVILLVMGGDMIRSAGSLSLSFDKDAYEGVAGTCRQPVIAGILGSLSNPYWILWWVTIGLGYLAAAGEYGFYGLAAFFGGHIAADYVWYVAVAFGISRGRRMMSDNAYQLMIRCCGVFLLGFGMWFLKYAMTVLAEISA